MKFFDRRRKRDDAKSRIKAIVDDLTSLQIRTIRRAELTGEAMMDPRHALFDIASKYNAELNARLAGDPRERVGTRILESGGTQSTAVQVRFVEPAYRPGEPAMLAVTVKSAKGEPIKGEPIKAMMRRARRVEPTKNDGGLLSRMVDGARDPATLVEARADRMGGAFLLMKVPDDARAGVCVDVEAAGVTVSIDVPLARVRGDLVTFDYLNRRANEAKEGSHWLIRRIELNSIRLVTMLQNVPAPDGDGCDTNDHSRRCLNGAEEGRPKPRPLQLGAPDLVALRKVWELGCEQIVMQTVVQLDGDVVTRISGDVEAEVHRQIHVLHADGVRVATTSWQFLVEALVGFSRSLLSWFTR